MQLEGVQKAMEEIEWNTVVSQLARANERKAKGRKGSLWVRQTRVRELIGKRSIHYWDCGRVSERELSYFLQ